MKSKQEKSIRIALWLIFTVTILFLMFLYIRFTTPQWREDMRDYIELFFWC
jgi:hypothetical protein